MPGTCVQCTTGLWAGQRQGSRFAGAANGASNDPSRLLSSAATFGERVAVVHAFQESRVVECEVGDQYRSVMELCGIQPRPPPLTL